MFYLLEKSFFRKKFSVGLVMDTNVREFDLFLEKNEEYIDNIYVSLPLGDKFHGRTYIQNQFHNPQTVELFWKLLNLIQSYDIQIEVVFNTESLTAEDLYLCRNALEQHNVDVAKIAVSDGLFEVGKELFPSVKIVKTVNEMPNSYEGFREIPWYYDEIVVGRHFIRDSKVFNIITKEKGANVVLLLNNGCSHICGGCSTFSHCEKSYFKALENHTFEYLYALQSIMPYELHQNYFDYSEVSIFKLSTRNGNTEYLTNCIDSYINNNAEFYINENTDNYLLWSRLKWHIPSFSSYNFEQIRKIKQKLCSNLNL